MTDSRPFISGQVVIDSLRDNGYKNAAYALAEIVDNSIQAKADTVRVICYEKVAKESLKSLKRINKIGILDNGTGMSADNLYKALEFGASENRNDLGGMGKFGMGLPNSSISQCKKVEIWSWINQNETYYTYLDIDKIKNGDLEIIPKPKMKDIDPQIRDTLGDRLATSGTFVLWSDLDRIQWKTSTSIYKHSEAILGRMYRYYLHDGDTTIWFDRYLEKDGVYVQEVNPQKFRANDPLYLLRNTTLPSLPKPYENEPFFNLERKETIAIKFRGDEHFVTINGSIVNPLIYNKIREQEKRKVGSTKWGKHAADNFGISIVRANRELELKEGGFSPTKEFLYEGRFIGVEVSFPPALDIVFGVLNNKQSAVNFLNIQKEEEAEDEGLSGTEYKVDLENSNDPKAHLFTIASKVTSIIEDLRKKLKELDFANYKNEDNTADTGSITEHKATEAQNSRNDLHPTSTDTYQPTLGDIEAVIEKGHGDINRDTIPSAEELLRSGLRYKIEQIPFDSSAFFDATSQNGFTLVQINKNHAFYTKIIQEVDEKEQGMLELSLAAWARMEDESSSNARAQYQTARRNWGDVLTFFLNE